MRRREFMALLGGTAATWPLAAREQERAMPVIGFLCSGSPDSDAYRIDPVREGLNESGYVEGQNLKIEYRWAEDQYDRLPALAAEFSALPVAVIVGIGTTPAVVAAKAATNVIPIVFVIGGDPVELGLVASLNRPAGNLTGVSFLNRAIVPKQFEMLSVAVPNAAATGYLVNPKNPFVEVDISDAQKAADSFRRKLLVTKVSTENDIDAAFAQFTPQGIGSALIGGDLFLFGRKAQIANLAARYAIPTLYPWREAAALGGLMSYGADIQDAFRLGGVLTAKILRGEKPAELPVEQASKVQFVINLKTAKALGIDFPLSLLGRADEVIE